MKLSREDAVEMSCGGAVAGLELLSDEVTSSSRWSVFHQMVIKDLSDNTVWAVTYSRGATEYQDESPFDDHDPEPVEMELVMVPKYVPRKAAVVA